MTNQYTVNKELINSWAKEYNLYGIKNKILFALWCLLGFIGIIGMILSVILLQDIMVILIYGIIIAFALIKLFASPYIKWQNKYKLYTTTYGVTEWLRKIEFSDDEITVTDHNNVCKFKYQSIEKIKETDRTILLYLKNNIVIRLYKNSFIDCTPEECLNQIKNLK